MQFAPLLALALLITGCSAVHVRKAPVEVPTIGLASASSLGDGRQLVLTAEAHLSAALAAERKRMRHEAAYHYMEAARFSYACLFFSTSDDRQTQVRDFYSFATEQLTSLLFSGVQYSKIHLGDVRLRLPYGQLVPRELIPASHLQFDGVRAIYRRDGFGAAFVAVAAPPDSASSSPTLYESRFLSATVVLRFAGATPEAVLSSPDATLDVYDPYRDEAAKLGERTVPLAANFTAPYALWLSRSQFHREAGRALLLQSAALKQPRIYAMQPYDPQRRTIVLIHGLASSPEGWVNLVNEIMGDEALRRRYQVWQVFYPTNLPIPENVRNIRARLLDALNTLDPDGTAPASQHMTLIGHSMGGVISRLLVVDSPDGLWQTIFDHPVDAAQRTRLAVLEPYLTLSPLPQVDRAIFLASPHRGSPMAHAWFGRAAANLVKLPKSILQSLGSLADAIAEELPLQADTLRHRQLSSVAYLSDEDRYLRATSTLPIAAGVTYHSIIGSNDEVVPYASSHLDGAASEQVVTSGHSVQQTAAAIAAIRAILRD
jgi:pimeloyl-ACP methyl ester carboxylesterase